MLLEDSESEFDDIDQFLEKKDKIGFNKKEESPLTEIEPIFDIDEDQTSDEFSEISENEISDKSNWGKKKDYYDADVEEVEYGSEEDAMDEENEAIALQKHQISELEEDDYGTINTMLDTNQQDNVITENESEDSDDKIVIQKAKNISKKEKLKYLKKKSPEIFEFLENFKEAYSELVHEVLPLHDRFELNSVSGKYLSTKHHLLLNYLLNLSFYFILKMNGLNAQKHPVISHILNLRDLLTSFSKIDEDYALFEMQSKKNTEDSLEEICSSDNFLLEESEYYPSMPKGRSTIKVKRNIEKNTGNPTELINHKVENFKKNDVETQNSDLMEDSRRKIGKEIEKNKGLTPYRKLNNPRVKHKLKFKKALKKRKTMVQSHKVGELRENYGGEPTGIRTHLIKSKTLH